MAQQQQDPNFVRVLRETGKGTAAEDADAALREVTRAVQNTGKAGSVTVTVKITPPKNGETFVMVTGEVSAKVPRIEPKPSIYFPTPDGDLSRHDPDQLDLITGEIAR